ILLFIPFILVGCYNPQLFQENQAPKIDLNNPCWQHTFKTYLSTSKSITQVLNEEILDYQSLVEQSLTYRAETIKVARRLKENINQDKPLSGYDLDLLNQGRLAHLEVRHKLYKVAESHECWLSSDTLNALKNIKAISPENQLKGIMFSLSAALILYDNYLLAISIFEEDDKLRRLINERDSGYGIEQNELSKITYSYHSLRKRNRVKNAVKLYEEKLAKISTKLRDDPGFNYLKLLIDQSTSYNMTKKYSPLYALSKKLEFMSAMTNDSLRYLTAQGTNLFSQFFGNTIGLIETRKGKLYNRATVLNQITRQLQAGDILLEKTPFRLTDKFIPGHWGHAAIWVGTEVELRRLGIWEHPLVKQYHQKIQEGSHIIEALRSGVQISALPDFLNIDDFVILRHTQLDNETLAKRIILALRQVGKAYDFNFDVETTDKIVCSELIYVVFIGIEWPTDKKLGRFTISPDNVASKALNGGPLKLITFFHDGKFVARHPIKLMRQLMMNDVYAELRHSKIKK
ncbi:YiiX/YebB-like N1pC/P60 family cysteine hydrolase, partial [Candidatus Marithioploca araucensis]|nr:YiiX/YebB-like N1pC/P60 family cysteine hydrolase [Candidatus Marithioploca araucensis]